MIRAAEFMGPSHRYRELAGPWLERAFYQEVMAQKTVFDRDYVAGFWTDYYVNGGRPEQVLKYLRGLPEKSDSEVGCRLPVVTPPCEGRDGMHNRKLWHLRLARQTFWILARTSYEREELSEVRRSVVGCQITHPSSLPGPQRLFFVPFVNFVVSPSPPLDKYK
jgi:hypothetical protein